MTEQVATGTFEVTMTPSSAADAPVGSMALAKRFAGDLEGSSAGVMLAGQGGVAGSAGYVAMERVTGTLASRQGSFVLQHSGTMDRGAPTLSVTVVPDSGTDGLTGLSGRLNIRIESGVHFYDLHYAIRE